MEPPNDLRTTVDHELVHILLDQHVGVHGLHVPRWFHEGLAQELASGLYLGVREEDLAYRVQTRTYIPFASLCDSFPRDDPARLALAYGQSFSFVAYLRGRVGLPALLAVARDCGPELPFSTALARRMKTAQIEYELEWCDYILHRSGAGYRVVLRNCFLLLMIVLAGPLLALAVARRRTREEALKRRMVREEAIAVAAAESPGPERPAAQGEDRSAADRRRDGRDSGDDWDGDGWDGDDWDGDGDTWNEAAWSDDELDDAEWDDAEWDDDEWDGDERDDRDGADPDGPGDLPPRPGRSVE
jgi:hypothetical protein